jgi:hypothetical protein
MSCPSVDRGSNTTKACYAPAASQVLTWINRPPDAIAGKKARRVAGFSIYFQK